MSLSHLFSYDVFLNRIKSLRFIVFQQLGHVCFHFGLSIALVFLRCFFKLFKSFFASFLQLFDVFLRRKNRF